MSSSHQKLKFNKLLSQSEQDQPTKMKEVYDQLKINEETLLKIKQFSKSLLEAFGSKRKWSNVINQIWSFGPRGNGPNLLVNQIPDYQRPSLLSCLEPDDVITGSYRENDQSIITGFQLATLSGPLCEEPLYSVCYVIEQWTMNDDVTELVTFATYRDGLVKILSFSVLWTTTDLFLVS